jgi:A/G-specific adenine glycosylase
LSLIRKSLPGNNSWSQDSESIIFFQKSLLKWYKKNGRRYPWREEADPFRILIAEMMLQRTRADQVVPVYITFVRRFPDVKSVYYAITEDISSTFLELGLFWRLSLLRQMAGHILIRYQGNVPNRKEELVTIPGIGEYISDAIMVFAFNKRRTIIDSNVVRLVTRYFGIPLKGEMRRNKIFREFCQKLTSGLKSQVVKSFNWSLLDHSAIVCKPVPLCKNCPLSLKCQYYRMRIKSA